MMSRPNLGRDLIAIGIFFSSGIVCLAQSSQKLPTAPSKPQQMQQAFANNEKKLRSYQWIETTTLTIDGKSKPSRQSICRYAADGKILKTPVGHQNMAASQQGDGRPLRGGLIRKEIAKEKIDKFKSEVEQIHALVGMYLPLDRDKLNDAMQTDKITFERDTTNGNSVTLSSYIKPNDQLKMTLAPSTMQMEQITLKTNFDKPKDALTVDVEFSQLPDGTTYPSMTTINAPSKKLSVTTVSSSFSKLVQ